MLRNALVGLCIASSIACASCSSGPTPGPTTDSGPLIPNDAYSASDPYSAARATCIAEINRLRATRTLPPYAAWTGVEMCVDAQATADQMANDPHGAWGMHAGVCDGSAQNECLGQGASGIVRCLGQMWAEREQAGCAGCDACADAQTSSCANCDFFGRDTGDVCGHYVNMSARYFDEAACGFSAEGGWAVINFR